VWTMTLCLELHLRYLWLPVRSSALEVYQSMSISSWRMLEMCSRSVMVCDVVYLLGIREIRSIDVRRLNVVRVSKSMVIGSVIVL